MMVAAVDQCNADRRTPEGFGGRNTAKASANDDHMWILRIHERLFRLGHCVTSTSSDKSTSEYSGLHWQVITLLRSAARFVLGARPSFCAARPTATAISTATLRTSVRTGNSGAAGFLSAGEFAANA